MGTNLTPLVVFFYEREFMLSLSNDMQGTFGARVLW